MSNEHSNIIAGIDGREKIIKKTGMAGILVNIVLAGSKAAVGMLSNSIAITLDALNNLSDVFSSVITILGAMFACKAPDKEHPLGHGRAEYISAMIVSAVVIYAGIAALFESVKKIISPQQAEYSFISLAVMAVSIAVKLILGRYVKAQGKKVNSGALIASGSDAFFDAILSASVLASALIFIKTGTSLEAWVGLFIAVYIIKAGVGMATETLDDTIGKRADSKLSKKIKSIITVHPEIHGAYDLIINNYGPNKNYASVHIDLPDTMTVEEVDRLTREIEINVLKETGVILTAIGLYSYNTSDDQAADMQNSIQEIVMSHDWALQMHGFYVDIPNKSIRFDVVLSFDVNRRDALKVLLEEIRAVYPDYGVSMTPDPDFSDL